MIVSKPSSTRARRGNLTNPRLVSQHREYWRYLERFREPLTCSRGEKPLRSVERRCAHCSRTFTVWCVRAVTWTNIQFCSPMCLDLVWIRERHGYEKGKDYAVTYVDARCEMCDEIKPVSWWMLTHGRRVCDDCRARVP